MLKIDKAIIQNGPHIKHGYKAVAQEGSTPKDRVRYHIDSEVGDIYDLLADMSKMIWLLNRKIEGTSTDDDIELEAKLKERSEAVDSIISKYYTK